jgi:hypothetical protein
MASKVKEAHAALELLLTKALVENKTGKYEIRIPYYELEKKPTDFEPVYLVVEFKTYWDDDELTDEDLYEHSKKTADKNSKH